jgi:hypothetical protein
VDFRGPFFQRDPNKTFRANIRDMMDKLSEEAERDVRLQLEVGQGSRLPLGGGVRPGRVSAHVVGRTKSLAGKRWQVTAHVSVRPPAGATRPQAIKLMAAASLLESRLHPFRRTAGRVRRARAVISANLTKGLT